MKNYLDGEWITSPLGQVVIFAAAIAASLPFGETFARPFALSLAVAMVFRASPQALAFGAIATAPFFSLGSAFRFLAPYGKLVGFEDVRVVCFAIPILCGSFFVLLASALRRFAPRYGYTAFVVVTFLLLALASLLPPLQAMSFHELWLALFVLSAGFYVWFFAYDCLTLADSNQSPSWTLWRYYRPFWSASFIAPFPGGESSLMSLKVEDGVAMRRCQSSGLQLLLLSLLYEAGHELFKGIFIRTPGAALWTSPWWSIKAVPMPMALEQTLNIGPFGFFEAWWIILAEFARFLLDLTARGHFIVGVIRILGFMAPKNTDAPIGAPTFVEFFSRYNFYFKELLFNIYYIPAYFGWSRRILGDRPKTRAVVATIFAAGIGNFVTHLFLHFDEILRVGFREGLKNYQSYAIYCAILSIAISGSQIRLLGKRSKPVGNERWIAPLIVFLFFALLRVFDDIFAGDVRRNLSLFLSALGIQWRITNV